MKAKELFCSRKIILPATVAVTGIFIALRYSDECRRGMEKGIGLCLNVLIPSLFFFMTVAAYLVQSGLSELLCRPLGGLSRRLFRLPPQAMAILLLSMLGGYPVGASCAAILHREKRLSPSEAAKTVYIAVAAGPGFVVSYVGGALMGNPQTGTVLLLSQVIAVLLTAVIVGHTVKSEPLPHPPAQAQIGENLLVRSVQSASRAALGMCAMVAVFCALSEVMDTLLPDRQLCDILSAALEITNGCSRACGKLPLYLTSFFIGFGGLSVHFQIFALLGDIHVKKCLFFLFRLMQGIIAAAATYIYLMVTPTKAAVFSSLSAAPAAGRSATPAGSAALVLSALLFVGSIAKKSVLSARPAKHTWR